MKPKTARSLAQRDLTPADISLAIKHTRKAKNVNTPEAVRFVATKFALSIAEVEDAAKAHREASSV